MEENDKKSKKLALLEITIGISVFIIVAIIPVLLGWLIPKESIIPNFIDSNDWIGFFGSYTGSILGGIVTLIVLWFTRKDTRDIQKENIALQNKILSLEEEFRLNNCRTFVEEVTINSNYNLQKHRDVLLGSKLIVSKDYEYIGNILSKDDVDYFNVVTKISNGYIDIHNVNQLEAMINDYSNFGNYIFKSIKNIGRNSMYNVNITLYGKFIYYDSGKHETFNGEMEFFVDYIGEGERIILPVFKLDKNIRLNQLNVDKVDITYDTSVMGMREKIKIINEYVPDKEAINRSISIEKINDGVLKSSILYFKYRYIN